ncbi:hypothetical protein FQA39_LY00151 [Lamprigera yunnana]|nr:hypothetical protein FQA39_LY00151 [Lamprigera yunnana]
MTLQSGRLTYTTLGDSNMFKDAFGVKEGTSTTDNKVEGVDNNLDGLYSSLLSDTLDDEDVGIGRRSAPSILQEKTSSLCLWRNIRFSSFLISFIACLVFDLTIHLSVSRCQVLFSSQPIGSSTDQRNLRKRQRPPARLPPLMTTEKKVHDLVHQ